MPRVSASGWSVSLTHPTSGRVIRPDVIAPNDVQYIPGPNTLPRIRLPVRRAPEWLTEQFDDNPAMSVYLDGNELPIDELVDVEHSEGRTLLVGEGGVELRTRVSAEYDAEERPVAATDLVDANTTYTTVDNTTAATSETVDAQNPSGESELGSNITLADTDPFVFTGGGIKPSQICFTQEGEDYITKDGTVVSLGSAYSDGSAPGVDTTGQEITWEFTPNHDIPAGELGIEARVDDGGAGDLSDGFASIEWRFENEFVVDLANTGGDLALGWDDLHNDPYGIGDEWESPALTAGTTYTITLECLDGGTASDSYVVDVIAPHDLRYRSGLTFDNDTSDSNGYLVGPELYPDAANAEFNVYESAFSIVGGSATVTMNDTTGSQALALSNDFGATYPITASNATSVSGTFASAGAALNLRVTFSRYSPSGTRDQTPREGYDAQRLDAYDLDAEVEAESLLIDQDFDDNLYKVLNQILPEEFGWTYSIENGTPTVTVDEPGSTTATRDPEVSEAQIDKRVQTYSVVTVKGSNLPVSGEQFQASTSFVNLNQDEIQTGSEAVYDDSGTQFTRGVDYEMNYSDGEIRALSGGDLSTSTTYSIDYRHQIQGTHTAEGATGDELVRTIPGVVSDRQAEQIAFVLAEIYPGVATPRYEGTIVVPRLDATFDPLEGLTLDQLDLPDVATPLSIRGEPELTPFGLALSLGSAPRLEESLSTIREQVSAVSDRV